MANDINNFIDSLARQKVSELTFNQFTYDNPHNEIRRNNFRLYLNELYKRKPKTILVGEAPGYQGMRQTGIPFMSEFIMLNGIEQLKMFGKQLGFKKTDEYPNKIWKEPTATIVWGAIQNLPTIPLLWASFPFHPHKGDPNTNRAPTNQELEIGRPYLKNLIEIFKIQNIIAVGNKAEQTLGLMGIKAPKVRHPSHGGKTEFVLGVDKYIV